MAGLRLGWSRQELDAACKGAAPLPTGGFLCLEVPKPIGLDLVAFAELCGEQICQIMAVHERPEGQLDWQWLNAFESLKSKLEELYGPGKLEHKGPVECESNLLGCVRAGSLMHRISWLWGEPGHGSGDSPRISSVLLVLGTMNKRDVFILFYRNTAWWVRELAKDEQQKEGL